jgi:hypothetical protein
MNPTFSAVYYSHNQGPSRLLRHCLDVMADGIAAVGGELITVTWEPVHRGDVPLQAGRQYGHLGIYRSIMQGAEAARSDIILLCEHDVLYPPARFVIFPKVVTRWPDALHYVQNFWHLTEQGFFPGDRSGISLQWLLSTCAARRDLIMRGCRKKIAVLAQGTDGGLGWAEFGEETAPVRHWLTDDPIVDVRHPNCFTGGRAEVNGVYLQSLSPWGDTTQYRNMWT